MNPSDPRDLHVLDQDAGIVPIERLLHHVLHQARYARALSAALLDVRAAGEQQLDVQAPDNLAHGAFRHGPRGAFRILHIEHLEHAAQPIPRNWFGRLRE
jgi:hypothetical protein